MKHTAAFLLTIFTSMGALTAQETQTGVPCPIDEPPEHSKKEATNLLEAFEHGHFHGHFRTYFMATDNTRQLSDYYAWAGGGGLHFSSAPWHGFNFGIGGVFNFNLASSDLGAKDSLTGAANRYEIGLFDVEDPYNRDDLDRIEELWLRYQWKKSRITVGQQSLQTPFINFQDGRMRPTAEAGAWAEINALKDTKIEGGWLWKISPRSTVEWYRIGESIGLYPQGLSPDGTPSGYPENLESEGVGLLGITRQIGKNIKIQAWDQFVENMFNTTFVQADHILPLKGGHKLLAGLQFIHQNALAYGGNEDASKTYFQEGEQSNTIGAQAGWQRAGWQALAAYTRITADGRFLAPREWGREPFYTFMPRERVEGSGDSHSVTGRVSWQTESKKLRFEAAYGHFYLPDVKDPALNKYAFPSFSQFNFDARYTFSGMFEGLRAQFLYVWKGRLGETYDNDKFVINKVDMSLFNLILNYTY
jgi:hypothetical protein